MKKNDYFIITLKNEKTGTYIRLGYILTGINLIPFILFLFYADARLAGSVGLVSTIIYFIIKVFIAKKEQSKYYIDENIFFVLAAVWLMQSSLMAILILLTGVLFKLTLQPQRFVFTKTAIQKDFFPKKEYHWEDMETVILKDGFLTLNFKNNKLIQAPVEETGIEDAIAFNKFAEETLSRKN